MRDIISTIWSIPSLGKRPQTVLDESDEDVEDTMEAEVTAIEQRARQTRWTLAIRWSVRGRGEFVLVGMAAILGFPLGDFKAIFPLGHFGEGGGREKEERSSMVAAATSEEGQCCCHFCNL
jgi:hypothetical protein